MRILRLFINNTPDESVNWILIDNNEPIQEGTSDFSELENFEDVQLEVYLNANCSSIFHTNITGISNKKLTEETLLGMIEEDIVDNIEDVKPILLKLEEGGAYIAVFNREFYETLILKLNALNKPIRFIQSFAFATSFTDNGDWTIYMDEEQRFVRTNTYEYFLLDDAKPIPELLKDMLADKPPASISIYTKDPAIADYIHNKYNVPCTIISHFSFGEIVWNVYNVKSSKLQFKLEKTTQKTLLQLLSTLKYFVSFIIAIWFLNMVVTFFANISLEHQLKKELSVITPIKTINGKTMEQLQHKVTDLHHQNGLYSSSDAIALMQSFLDTVSNVGTEDIIQINYAHNQLEVFLSNNFNSNQFVSYQNIFKTQHINAMIQTYKTFTKQMQPDASQNDIDQVSANITEVSDNTAWVITLQPSLNAQQGISK